MFNGMMDPELMRLAQEQMSRLSPSELAKMQQQMMSNPELLRMASESMKNMRPEDLRNAAEQLKNARTEDMAEISKKIANSTPEEVAAIAARADAQLTYELNSAQMLKKQGNELHNQGNFGDAAQKYLRAKNNLKDIPVSKGRALQLVCSLNLMSCYLKTKQYDECIKEGSEVLQYDADNVKALYRRGQAYKELGLLEEAVSDLSKAHIVAPDDETIADVLRDTNEIFSKEGGRREAPRRLVVEEIIEEVGTLPPESSNSSSSTKYSVIEPQEAGNCSQNQSGSKIGNPTSDADSLQSLKDNPEAIRSFQNFISNADPDTLAALNARNSEGVSPDMIKTASNIMSKMSPEELQEMVQMASSFQGENPFFSESTRPGSLPQGASPDMLKAASGMMSKMSPEDLQKMFEIASTMNGKESAKDARSKNGLKLAEAGGIPAVNRNSDVGESSSSRGLFSSSRSDPSPPSNIPTSMTGLQEQMRNQMNDPASRQMFTDMFKNISPDMMANMSEQFGFKLSKEEAQKAQQAMSSLSPDDLDRMMRWADRLQRGVEVAKKTKNWLLGRPGLILAVCFLILAFILQWLGYIGS